MRALLMPFALTGCMGFGNEVPGTNGDLPTWESGIEEMLAVNCVVCHTEPSRSGAPDYFRLDSYESEGDDLGAIDILDKIQQRAVDRDPAPMPPGVGLPDAERDLLARWIALGGPETGADIDTGAAN